MIRTTPRPASLATIHHAWLGSGRPAFTDLSQAHRARLDYDAFDELCARIAGRLAELGIVAGDRVGLLGENSLRWAAAFFAILRLGAVAVPLSPRQPDDTLARIGSDAGLRLVLHDDAHAGRPGSPRAERLAGDALLGTPVAPANVDPADTRSCCTPAAPPAARRERCSVTAASSSRWSRGPAWRRAAR